MRQIPEDKPLSPEDRKWLNDWCRFDTIRRIDDANGVEDDNSEATVREADLRVLLESHGYTVDGSALDALKAALTGHNGNVAEPSNHLGDSAAHVAPGSSEDEDEDGEDGKPYEEWSKADLQSELAERELSKSGNVAELIERLEESDAAGWEA